MKNVHRIIIFFLLCTPFVLVRSAYAACTLSTASNTFTVTSSCAFDGSVDGVDADSGVADKNGAVLKVAQNQTLTVSANQTLAVGSLNMSGATSGKIVLLSGAQIKPGAAVYMTDSDNDHIPSGTTQVLVPNNGAGVSGTISKRKYTVTNPTATDCNDSISGHNNTLPASFYVNNDLDSWPSANFVSAGTRVCSSAANWDTTSSFSAPGETAGMALSLGGRTNAGGTDCNDSLTGHNYTLPSAVYYIDSDTDTYTAGSGNSGTAICSNASTWDASSGASGVSSPGSVATTWTGKRLAAANGADCKDDSSLVWASHPGGCNVDMDSDGFTLTGSPSYCTNSISCGTSTVGYCNTNQTWRYATQGQLHDSTSLDCDDTFRSVDNLCPYILARLDEGTSTDATTVSFVQTLSCSKKLVGNPAPVAYGPVLLSSPYLNSFTRYFVQNNGFLCPSANFFPQTQKFTVTAWVWMSNPSVNGGIADLYDNDLEVIRFVTVTGDRLRLIMGSNNINFGPVSGTIPMTNSTWHRVAAVWDGTLTGNAARLKMYVDGVQQTVTFAGTIPAGMWANITGPLEIGSYGVRSTNYFYSGYLDEIRLYNGSALTLPQLENAWANQ